MSLNALTVFEAKNRWCPLSGHATDASTLGVKPGVAGKRRVHEASRCLGPDCMWWQWLTESRTLWGRCGAIASPVDAAQIVDEPLEEAA